MDLYRSYVSNLGAVEDADGYFRRYSGDFTLFPHNDTDFSLEDALTRLRHDGALGTNFVMRLRLNCENTKHLLKSEEVRPTSVFVCHRNAQLGNFEVVKEIHI